jgi:DNA (cytosine-5)-methyltransferase 1
MRMKVLDLFSGIGGFSLGLERTGGYETEKFCEVNPYCVKVLNKHWPNVEIHNDIQTLNAESGRFDVVCGGFPCQDISYAGKGAGLAGQRSGLWFQMCRIIEEAKPSWVIAENVSALRSRGLEQVLGSLSEIGYNAQWHCIPAFAVGAPHKRDRIWIVAYPDYERNNTQQYGNNRRWKTSANERKDKLLDRTSRCSSNLGYTNSKSEYLLLDGSSEKGSREITPTGQIYTGNPDSIRSADLADCIQQRLERYTGNGKTIWKEESDGSTSSESLCGGEHSSGWWLSEPAVGRVVNGVSNRVDRIKCLGNSIVPQISEVLGNAILDYEKKFIYNMKSPSGISESSCL